MADFEGKELDTNGVLNDERPQRPRQAALHSAIRRNNSDEVQSLLEQGADIEAPDLHGRRAIHVACSIQNGDDVVKMLIAKNAKLTSLSMDGYSPLHHACVASASKGVVEALLSTQEARERLLELKKKEKTALQLAIEHKREDIVPFLLECGAQVNSTCLEAASGNESMISILDKYNSKSGVDVRSVSPEGNKKQKLT